MICLIQTLVFGSTHRTKPYHSWTSGLSISAQATAVRSLSSYPELGERAKELTTTLPCMITHTAFPNKCLTLRTDTKGEADVTLTFQVAPCREGTLEGLPKPERISGVDSICPMTICGLMQQPQSTCPVSWKEYMHIHRKHQIVMVTSSVCPLCHLHTPWDSSEGLMMVWQDFYFPCAAVHPIL